METVSKNKRGRPATPVVTESYTQYIRTTFSEVKTRRGIKNKEFESLTLEALNFESEFEHIATREKMMHTVLYELGRIVDKESIRMVAREVCQAKLKGRGAVGYIRWWRGVSTGANVDGLTRVIANAIFDYAFRHGGSLDNCMVASAMDKAWEISTAVMSGKTEQGS